MFVRISENPEAFSRPIECFPQTNRENMIVMKLSVLDGDTTAEDFAELIKEEIDVVPTQEQTVDKEEQKATTCGISLEENLLPYQKVGDHYDEDFVQDIKEYEDCAYCGQAVLVENISLTIQTEFKKFLEM
jgi:hypothetical protein